MEKECSKTNKEFKKDCSDMEISYLESLIFLMELSMKDLYKMDKNLEKALLKDQMDSIILVILNMINLMALDKFITLINQLTLENSKMESKMEKVI